MSLCMMPQAELLTARLRGLDAFEGCRGVSIYLSMPQKEVTTVPILTTLFAATPAKRVFVPKAREGGMVASTRNLLHGEACVPSEDTFQRAWPLIGLSESPELDFHGGRVRRSARV
jgi:hypothetical protein